MIDSAKPSWKILVEQFINETTELDTEWEQLRIGMKRLKDEKKKMETFLSNTDVIRLNVGGEMMMTTRASLTRIPTSILAIAFNGHWEEKLCSDLDGNLFFDFNPALFRHLLQQLQNDRNIDSLHMLPQHSVSSTMIPSYAKMLKKLRLGFSMHSSANDVLVLNVGGHSILTRRHRFDSMKLISLLSQSSEKFIDADPQVLRRFIKQYHEEKVSCFPSVNDSSNQNDQELVRFLKRFNVSGNLYTVGFMTNVIH